MGSKLKRISQDRFKTELVELLRNNSGRFKNSSIKLELTDDLMDRLWVHYSEICLWNARLSLIGPGTGSEVVRRHYWESLEGLAFLKKEDRTLVDIGSGGGFPGWVLSAALPEVETQLIEPREKKWAFLRSTIRKAGLLSCRAVNARVEIPLPQSLGLPETIDVVTSRALVIPKEVVEALIAHSPHVRFLFWVGKEEVHVPDGFVISRSTHLPGSDHRRIVEISRSL